MADIGDRLGPKDGSFDGGVAPMGPLLPPFRLRTAREEQSLRQTHWKDLYASDQPSAPWWLRADALRSSGGAPFKHWSPSGAATNGDVQSLLQPPTVKPDGTVALSQDGAGDAANVAAGKGPRVVAQEAEKRPPNTTIQTQQEGEGGWKFGVKGERGAELKQEEKAFGGRSGTSLRDAAGQSLTDSSKSFKQKYPRDATAELSRKLWDQSTAVRTLEDKVGPSQGKLEAFYAGTEGQVKGSVGRDAIKGEVGGSAGAGVLKGERTYDKGGKGLLGGEAKGRAVSAEAEAKAQGEVNWKEREATLSGSLGASAVLLEGEVGGEVRITPRRLWNGIVVNGVNTAASWWGYDKQLQESDKIWDFGIVLGLGVGGTVGAAAEAKGEAKWDKSGGHLGGKVKLAPGIGGSVRGKAGFVW